jgi:hypothetical protein
MLRFAPLLVTLVWTGGAAGQVPGSPAGPPDAPVLDLRARSPAAPTGSEFARDVRGLPLEDREARIVEEVLSGNVPSWLRALEPVRLDGPHGEVVTVWVTPDYVAIGSDVDHLLMPMTPGTAQRIADALGASLPTPRLVDAIWSAARLKLAPAPIDPSPAMTTVPVFVAHQRTISQQRRAAGADPGTLAAGHKKDVVVSRGVAASPGRVAIYGWHRTDGSPIQPLYLGHTDGWVDYSHGVRLVLREILVDGASMDLWDALRDPHLAPALSSEGVLAQPRYEVR